MLRVGIIGAGEISKSHADAYQALGSKVRVAAVADKDLIKAEQLAKGFRAQVFDDAEELMKAELDIVDICLPTFLHEQFVIAAAGYGKHVFCEKPIALSLEAADRMIAETKKAGVKFMVGQCIRFWPEYVAVRERLAEGDLGSIKVITAGRIASAPNWSWDNWILQPDLSGGAVIDLHIHDVDFVNALIPGTAQIVSAVGSNSQREALDHISTLIDYGDGVVASIEGNWLVPDSYPFTMALKVVCEQGTIEFVSRGIDVGNRDESAVNVMVYKQGQAPEVVGIPERKDAYLAEIEYFVDCVLKGQDPAIVTAQDARESLALVLAAKRSVLERQSIRV